MHLGTVIQTQRMLSQVTNNLMYMTYDLQALFIERFMHDGCFYETSPSKAVSPCQIPTSQTPTK